MPSTYHLHSPSQADLKFLTPPASPGRTFVSPYPMLTAADVAGTTCDCGHQMFDTRGCCSACIERQQQRHYVVSSLDAVKALEPPPDQLSRPRELSERAKAPSIPRREMARPSPPLGAALHSVSSSQGESKHNHMLPAHLHPSPRGVPTTAVSTIRPGRVSTIQHSEDHIGPIVGRLARLALPTWGTSGLGLQDYSPMGASLARISRANMRGETAVDE